MPLERLKQFGLSDKEVKIYVTLLELGQATVNELAKKSKIKRTSIYDILSSLKEKGLVGSIMNKKRKYYIASDPRELELKLEERKLAIKSIIPELLSISNLIDKKPKIRYYEGEGGLKETYLDTLNYPNQPMWAWVTEDVFGTLDDNFISHYLSNRVKNRIWAYVITPDTPALRTYKSQDNRFLRKTLIEKSSDFDTRVEIILYGSNIIGVLSFKEKMGLIIESQKIFDTLKSIFQIHWKNLGGE